MTSILWAFPFASVSAFAMYAILIALSFARVREVYLPLPITHFQGTSQHFRGFDAYRGLAAVFVAAGHCWFFTYPVFAETQLKAFWLEYGSAAVPIFCVLSGFLIYRSVQKLQTLADLRAYGIRRLFRIWPVYAAATILLVFWGFYGNEAPIRLFVGEIFMYYAIGFVRFANPVAWSLYIELIFYCLLPMFFVVVGRRRMALFALVGAVTVAFADLHSREFGLWQFFMLGVLASEISPMIKRHARWLFVVGLALLLFDLSGVPQDTDWAAMIGFTYPRFDRQTTGLGIGFMLMLASTPHLKNLGKGLDVYPLRLLGLVSYSLYVTHPIYILANFPGMQGFSQNVEFFGTFERMPWWYLPIIFVPGAIFWAIVSYVLIEKPGISVGSYLSKKARRADTDRLTSPPDAGRSGQRTGPSTTPEEELR